MGAWSWIIVSVAVAVAAAVWALQRRYRLLRYGFYLRFPLALAAVTVGFPIVASFGPGRRLLDNMFNVSGWLAPACIGVATAWTLSVIWLAGELIFRAADTRFGHAFARAFDGRRDANDHWLHRRVQSPKGRSLLMATLLGVGGVPTFIAFAVRAERPIAAAAVSALGFGLVVAMVVHESRTRPLSPAASASGEVVPDSPMMAMRGRFDAFVRRVADWLRLSEEVRRGYSDLAGHRLATGIMLVSAVTYLVGAFALRPGGSLAEVFPAAGYVLLLLTLMALFLPAMSFQLDLFRVPPLPVLILATIPLRALSGDDHYYATQPVDAEAVDLVEAVDRRFEDDDEPTLVVVAASGGGGQAAVWTAEVLARLATEEDEWGRDTVDSIAMVSSASGGSVGAMFWVDGYTRQGPPRGDRVAGIRQAAASPALEAISWGLLYPDLLRLLVPPLGQFGFPLFDRGRALELAWNRRFSAGVPTLASWRAGVREGWRPLLIFNSVAVESGQRVLLAAADLEAEGTDERAFRGALLVPGRTHDVEVATAARLSAAFPYINPAGRAKDELPAPRGYPDAAVGGQHLVDGGYYDNYGMVTTMQWLDRVLGERPARFRRVVIIEIRSMPGQFDRRSEPVPGWLADLAGPLLTLGSTRVSSQVDRNDWARGLFAQRWCSEGVEIASVHFEARTDARLTWSITPDAAAEIRRQWDAAHNVEQLGRLRALMTDERQPNCFDRRRASN